MSASSLKKPLLSNTQYDVLKHVASVGLPALNAFYFSVAQLWHLPDTTQVCGTIAAVNTCLGALVGVSSIRYNNSDAKYAGVIEVAEDEAKQVFSLVTHGDPSDLAKMATATFKVSPVAAPPAETGFAEPQNPPTFN